MPPAAHPPVIVDTNILFSALLSSRSRLRDVLFDSDHTFHVGESALVELFAHRDRVVAASKLSEDAVMRTYALLLRRVVLSREELISGAHWAAVRELCDDVDPSDVPQVALTLALAGRLWTGDKRLKEGLLRKGFGWFFLPGPR